ncbi:cell wall hydrolase [Anaerosporobacter faecicola]|uniref:cell wall hydrolase n=1 Tax=Anaerosporobacter faecicola TaxID=2718714 RepID=UPI001EE5B484|nr:cell wall hydrolase [Anaerosporobacter faecicola]
MLKIHSFLHRIKESMKYSGIECYKSCLMITAYAMAAVILVLCADSSLAAGNNHPEAYAKAASVKNEAFEEAKEETAKKAQIQAENENVNILAQKVLGGEVAEDTENYSLQIVNRTIIAADKREALMGQTVMRDFADIAETEQVVNSDEQNKSTEEQAAVVKKATVKNSEQKKSKSKAKEKKAAASKKDKESVPTISLGTDDKEVLLRIVEAEATGEDIKGKMLVANVILNRVKSSQFPDTVAEVVFQKNGKTVQFSPIADGRYWSVTISKSTREAVERVLNGEDKSQGALYFSARSKAKKSSMNWFDTHLTWLFKYGGHEFYK